MADNEDELLIKIDEPEVEKKSNGADTSDPVGEVKSQFEELEKTAERERLAREAAERREADAKRDRDNALKERDAARTEVTSTQFESVASGIEAAEAEASAAEREYQTAFEAGDSKGVTAAQRKIARAEASLLRLNEAKADLEARKKAPTEDADTRRSEPEKRADPVEAYIANRTEPTQKWLRAHTEFITDAKKNAKLTAAHYSAVGDGIEPDSDAYFEHVETFVGLRKTEQQTTTTKRKATVHAAPVGNSGGGMNGGSTEVRLTKGEALAATDGTHTWNYDDPSGQKRFKKGDPIGTVEFARRKLEMTRQGLYDRSLTEQ